jgi:hypothetical protein
MEDIEETVEPCEPRDFLRREGGGRMLAGRDSELAHRRDPKRHCLPRIGSSTFRDWLLVHFEDPQKFGRSLSGGGRQSHSSQRPTSVAGSETCSKPGGQVCFIDLTGGPSPLLDTHLQSVELARDPSQVRSYTNPEWLSLFQTASFDAHIERTWRVATEFSSWLSQIGTGCWDDVSFDRLIALYSDVFGR